MTATSTNPRVVYRNRPTTLKQGFWNDAAKTIPTVPQTGYPSYTVYDITGVAIQTGVATADPVTAGVWVCSITLNTSNPLSAPNSRYRIDWTIVSTTGAQLSSTQEFDVVDANVEPNNPDDNSTLIVRDGDSAYCSIVLSSRPTSISVELVQASSEYSMMLINTVGVNGITETDNGDGRYTYSYVFPATWTDPRDTLTKNTFVNPADYLTIWKVDQGIGKPPVTLYKRISVVGIFLLTMFPEMRSLIDRIQMKRNRIQSYSDADLYEYIKRGADLINSVHPVTPTWGINKSSPLMALKTHWLMASLWYALNAQQLMEIYLQFDFQGSQTTLNVDRAQPLAEVIQRSWDTWQEQLKNAKTGLFRAYNPVGGVGTRPMTAYGAYKDRIYKISTVNGMDFTGNGVVAYLNGMGLI